MEVQFEIFNYKFHCVRLDSVFYIDFNGLESEIILLSEGEVEFVHQEI